jgi:hypothetical protein
MTTATLTTTTIDRKAVQASKVTFKALRPQAVRELALYLMQEYGTVEVESTWLSEEMLKLNNPDGPFATFNARATANQWKLFVAEMKKFPKVLQAEQEAAELKASVDQLMAELDEIFTAPVADRVVESDIMAHIEDTRLFWVTRHGRPTKRSWSELTKAEQRQQREAEERQAYVAMFSIY